MHGPGSLRSAWASVWNSRVPDKHAGGHLWTRPEEPEGPGLVLQEGTAQQGGRGRCVLTPRPPVLVAACPPLWSSVGTKRASKAQGPPTPRRPAVGSVQATPHGPGLGAGSAASQGDLKAEGTRGEHLWCAASVEVAVSRCQAGKAGRREEETGRQTSLGFVFSVSLPAAAAFPPRRPEPDASVHFQQRRR